MAGGTRRAITGEIAAWAVATDYAALPGRVQVEAARAFLNWAGCVLGGCRGTAAARNAAAAVAEAGGAAQATLIGFGRRATTRARRSSTA